MSGGELCLSVLGALIPVLQGAISAKGHKVKSGEARAHAKTIAELQNDIGQEQFAAIYSNLQSYREVVEPNVDEKDRVFISHVQKSIYRTVKSYQETLQALSHASRPGEIRAIEDKLSELGKHLNNFELRLMQRFLLLNFQRLDRDGCVGFVQIPSEQSENLTTTLRSDVEPIKVGYDDDPQLDWPISTGDVTLLESLFDPDQDNTAPASRPSLALLLACRKRLPKIVELCLDYSADPTVTGEDGLGAIHNAIGTADVIHDPPEIMDILNLLRSHGVDVSVRDSTKERLRPLHRAVMTKNVSATRFLLESNPDMVNLEDANSKTALFHACATPNQKLALIETLVENHADFAGEPRPPMPDHNGQIIARYLDEKGLQ